MCQQGYDMRAIDRLYTARGMSRRSLLRQAAGVAFASPILVTALAACGGDDDDDDSDATEQSTVESSDAPEEAAAT